MHTGDRTKVACVRFERSLPAHFLQTVKERSGSTTAGKKADLEMRPNPPIPDCICP